jgi:RNA polymerase sigma-70 factor (ECF subfamily)
MTVNDFNHALEKIGRDDSGFVKIYQNYYEGVFYSAYAIVNDRQTAEEIASDVFYKIYTSDHSQTYIKHPKAYLYTATRNTAIEYLKKELRYTGIDILAETADTLDEDFILEKIAFDGIFKELYSDEKKIIAMHGLMGFTLKEIAKELNIPYNTVKNKYARTIKKLQEKINKKYF